MGQGRIQRLDHALVVDRRHAGGDVLQHGVQVPALGDLDTLAVENAQGLFERLAHRVLAQ